MINNLYIYATWKCNLHCGHCWVSAEHTKGAHGSEILPEKYKDIINQACDIGVNFVKISGGEPLLCWNAVKVIIDTAKARDCSLLLETNGTLLDPEKADYLKNMNCDISISLDGNQSKHNELRNDLSAFQRTCKGINLLVSRGVIPQIVYSFSVVDYEEIDSLINLLSSFGIRDLKMNPIMRVGRAKSMESKTHIESAYTISFDELLKLKNLYCSRPRNNLRIRMMLPLSFDGYSILMDKNVTYISCPYESLLSVLPNGDVGLCGEARHIKEFMYGNIFESSFSEIVNSSKNFIRVQRLAADLQGVCKSCAAKKICKGSCRVVAYQQSHDIYSSNPLCEAMYRIGCFPF